MITLFEALVVSAITIITYAFVLTLKQYYEENKKR